MSWSTAGKRFETCKPMVVKQALATMTIGLLYINKIRLHDKTCVICGTLRPFKYSDSFEDGKQSMVPAAVVTVGILASKR